MSDTHATALYTALLAFQRAVGPVKKDASNPAFRTKYATLQSVLETVEEPLSDNGLVLLQRFETDDAGRMLLVTEIAHAESGQRVASVAPVVSKDPTDPQKMGGAITYYRRYSLLALLGLAPEDDDGNAASKPAPPARKQEPSATEAQGMRLYPGTGAARSSAPAPAISNTRAVPAQIVFTHNPPADSPLEHPLLATIRDDEADPKARKRAVHDYYMGADTIPELDKRATTIKGVGLPEAEMTKAFNWHSDRIDKR